MVACLNLDERKMVESIFILVLLFTLSSASTCRTSADCEPSYASCVNSENVPQACGICRWPEFPDKCALGVCN
jgi:hypothetical protein